MRSELSRRALLVAVALMAALPAALALAGAAASNTVLLPRAEHAFGYRNPEVRQSNLASTVCQSGYSATIRPPVSYTSFLKREELRFYKLPGSVSDYEFDHLISLSLGGSPYDTRNLWMQLDSQARRDDRLESRWHRDLGAGRLTLRQAQAAELAYKRAHGQALRPRSGNRDGSGYPGNLRPRRGRGRTPDPVQTRPRVEGPLPEH